MTSLLDNVNTTRESMINIHYAAAVAELEEKIKNEPLGTVYHIYSGCISKDVTYELARRFNSGNVKATPVSGGLIFSKWYLELQPTLPSHLS